MQPSNVRRTLATCVFITFLLPLLNVSGQTGPANSWTKPSSGFWEEASSWSLGVLPNSSQSVLITNQNWKAVGITPSTAVNFPSSMTVDSVTVRGAFDTFNTLLLQYVGTRTPLTVLNGVTLQDMARILNFDSALVVQGGTIVVTNAQIVQDGGFIRTTNATMYLQNADYHLTNGVFEGGQVLVGLPVSARFNQYGGKAVISDLAFGRGPGGAGGTYSLYGGELSLPNGLTIMGDNNASSHYLQAGGTNRTTTVFLEAGLFGVSPSFTLNGGLLADNDVKMVGDDFGAITITHNGGTHSVSNTLTIAGGTHHGEPRPSAYVLNGGWLLAGTIDLAGHTGDALFIQTNGIAQAELIEADAPSDWGYRTDLSLSGGTLTCENLRSDTGVNDIDQSGGSLWVNNTIAFSGWRDMSNGRFPVYSRYAFLGGTLFANNINVGGVWIIGDSSAPRITNPGTCSLSHTLQVSNAVEQLGRFILAANGTIDLAGSASRLSFANSSVQTWNGDAWLTVANWNGSPSGGGAEQLKFGNNQSGLTPAQLRQILFQISSNFYSAKILSSGEVVPDKLAGAPMNFSKAGNTVSLTWPSGWFLQSATNVAGPYSDISGATSPYGYDTTQAPQQFFRLRQ